MGLVKRAADLAFTFRFIRMLVLDWEDWDAYKLGIIDDNGKRIKSKKVTTDEEKSAWTPFIRLAANVKRLLSKIPGGSSKLGSFAAALFLIKENYNLTDKQLDQVMNKLDVDPIDLMVEQNEWFLLENKQLSPGVYRLKEDKILNETFEEVVRAKDQIRIHDDSFPVGSVFGIDIYEATHMRTRQNIYVAVTEIYK